MEIHRGLRIEDIQEDSEQSTLHVTVCTSTARRSKEIRIDPRTAELLRGVCSERPFKWRHGERYSYWIEGVGHVERKAWFRRKIWNRWDPRIYLLIRRGKSRLKRTVPCAVCDHEALRPVTLEALDEGIREQIEQCEAGRSYRWRVPSGVNGRGDR